MKTKHLILIVALALCKIATAQKDTTKNKKDDEVLISIGTHIGFWYAGGGSNEVPVNLTFDYKTDNDLIIGLAASHELYEQNFGNFAGHERSMGRRVNARFRVLHLIKDKKNLEQYLGMSAGFSRWSNYPTESAKTVKIWPTAQLIYRIQYNFSNDFFWNTELALGPPYACQMALGVKF